MAILSRRQFIKLGMIGVGSLMVGFRITNKVYAAASNIIKSLSDYMKERLQGIYKRDASMEIRCSQDNPMIKYAYKKFFITPMSPVSEDVLHTSYIDRSCVVKKLESEGIFSREQFNNIPIKYPCE